MKKSNLSKAEVTNILENFVEGRGGVWDWDDFTLGMSLDDEQLESIRERVARLSEEFPHRTRNEYTNEHGLQVIRDYIKQLRNAG